MKFQEKLSAFAGTAAAEARARFQAGKRHAQDIRKSLGVLNTAGQELGQVARHHAARFVEQNSPLFAAAGKDLSALARSTFQSLVAGEARTRTRKANSSRRRTRKAS